MLRSKQPWLSTRNPRIYHQRTCTVVGGGIAGTGIALSLARRGWRVTLIEQAKSLGAGASGNAAGVILPHLGLKPNHTTALSAHGVKFVVDRMKAHWNAGRKLEGELCGVLSLAHSDEEFARQGKIIASGHSGSAGEFLDLAQASERAGIAVTRGGVFFPETGWVNPPSLCEANCEAAGKHLTRKLGSRALKLNRCDQTWQVVDASGALLAESEAVVLANGFDCRSFEELSWLELFRVRGQTQMLVPTEETKKLRTVLSCEGYVTPGVPSHGGQHCSGATFDWKDMTEELRQKDADDILENLTKTAPAFGAYRGLQASGRVGYRCTSPDALPLVGPVPDFAAFQRDYHDLHSGRAAELYPEGTYLPGLYASVGHGSRGLVYSQLGGELLAEAMSGETCSVELDLFDRLSLSRFLIRKFRRRDWQP